MDFGHAPMSRWRYGVCMLAVVFLPAVAVHTVIIVAAALFMIVTGIFAFADGEIVQIGIALAAFGLMLLRFCWWMLAARKVILRSHRALLGALILVLSLVAWMLAPVDPMVARAVVSMAIMYALFGIYLAVNAWEDTGGS